MSTLPLHIASASDEGYLPALEVLVCSTLLHANRDIEVHFHIFDGGISPEGWSLLERHAARFHSHAYIHRLSFNQDRFVQFPGMQGNYLSYARLLLGEALPALDKIVYLDCDILVGRDVAELRDLDAQGLTLLVAGDHYLRTLADDCPWLSPEEGKIFRYFNSGVLVIDLKRWRAQKCLERCFETIDLPKLRKPLYHDQTILNYVLRDDVKFVPQNWNQVVFASEDMPIEPAIIHLIGRKPWRMQTTRFDHYLWLAFYSDMIQSDRRWVANSPFSRRLLVWLPRRAATRWIFRFILATWIFCTKQESERVNCRETLRQGNSDFRFLREQQCAWRRQCRALGIAPTGGH